MKLDNIDLFSIITFISVFLCIPIALASGGAAAPAALAALPDPSGTAYKIFMAGVCFHAYQQVSYMVLERVSTVSHSVGKCVKSVVVIVASIIVFKNPVSPLNALGTGIALAGVYVYGTVKRKERQAKYEAAQLRKSIDADA